MNLRWNAMMLNLLGGDPEFLEPSSIIMPESLKLIAALGFKEVDGCVVESSCALTPIFTSTSPQTENTGYEGSLFTEINVERFLIEPISISELARLGLDFGFLLRKELIGSGLPGPFRVIVRVRTENRILNICETCTVRFQTLRPSQVRFYDDLEKYQAEAMAILDF